MKYRYKTGSLCQFSFKENQIHPKFSKTEQRLSDIRSNNKIIQFAIKKEDYKIDGDKRSLYYDERGYFQETGENTDEGNTKKHDISIIYETIGKKDDAEKCITNFANMHYDYPNSPVGLSIVINQKISKSASKEERDESINNLQVNTDNVPNINIEYDLLEYDADKDLNGQIPYYSLRRRAVVNDGAINLYTEMSKRSTIIWRKMGDSDMVFHSPLDTNDRQISKLQLDGHYKFKKMVTFGYILNNGVQYIIDLIKSNPNFKGSYGSAIYYAETISDIIDYIYKKEMELRKNVDYKYPIEPTTYYKLDRNELNKLLKDKNRQIREGETFKEQIINKESEHMFDGSILETTGAGKRNDDLIAYIINQLCINQALDKTILHKLITNLNQSIFNTNTKKIHGGEDNKLRIINDIITYITNKLKDSIIHNIISQMNKRRYQQLDLYKSHT